jgi:hypothetical protein
VSIKASPKCGKQQQATTTLPIAMGAIEAITDRDGCNQRLHREVPKRSQEEPFKRNKEGRGDQPWSHKAASPMNATRASWGRCEYHEDTHIATTTIAARASIVAKRARQTQAATFANQRRSQGLYAQRNDGNYRHPHHDQRKQHKLCNNGGHGDNKLNNKKSLPKRKDKSFKPWCLHGKQANHSHDECRTNLHNQVREQQQQVQATKKQEKTKPSWHVRHASHAWRLLEKQQI